MSTTTRLTFWVFGDNYGCTMNVDIALNNDVGDLKKAIKEEMKPAFDYIPTHKLDLWKVSVPFDDDFEEKVKALDLAERPLPGWRKLDSLFSHKSANADDCLDIVVKVPTVVALAQLLSLNCVVHQVDEKLSRVFTVKIPKTKNISILKDLIKKEQSPRLNHVNASDLIISQVSLPVDDDLEETLKKIDLIPLNPLLPLSQVFPVEENRLHIVVQVPTDEDLGIKVGEERRDQIPALRKRFQNLISRISKARYPTHSSNYPESQIAYFIHDGRYKASSPRTSVTPQIQLFHPVFGHFLDSMKSNDTLPDNIILQTVEYMKAATAIYESGSKRRQVLTPLLCAILGVNIQTIVKEDKTNPDDIVTLMTNRLRFIILVREDKKEFGVGDSDPSIQAALSVGRCWAQFMYTELRNATVCPTFFLATAGPWIAILGVVITDGVIVQRLTNYLWAGLDSVLNESRITHVARAFYALRASLEKLTLFYESLNPMGDLPADTRYFPSITAYCPHGGGHVKFKYVGFLENGLDCITFRARTETIQAQDIVVKFVNRYGQAAHELLAEHDLAPKLLYCGSPHFDDDEPSYQSISMVVMEYIDGVTCAEINQKMSPKLKETVKPAVEHALRLLHGRGLVFGDLRLPNIMITKDSKVKLIDFDWAGEEGQVKYPLLISSHIAWPEGVKGLAVIRREHDLEMLTKLM